MRQKKIRGKKDNNDRWLLTYSDLMNLLLILFILLYAMSSVSQEKYDELAESLTGAFGGSESIMQGGSGVLPGNESPDIDGKGAVESSSPKGEKPAEGKATSIDSEQDMEEFKGNIDEVLLGARAGTSIVSSMEQRGLVISFRDNVFFDSGKDELKDEMKDGLNKMAALLNRIDNNILVEGHTDNVPIKNSRFTSNWQLSSIRAANVAQYLVDQVKIRGDRLSAAGYGENQPIASNQTEEGRSRNRRINLVILYGSENK